MANLAEMLGKTSTKNPGSELVSLLMKAQADAKITHLEQPVKILPKHTAMGMFYDAIGDIIDDFAECYRGLYPDTSFNVPAASCIPDQMKYFTSLYNTIEDKRKTIKESFLQNMIDEAQKEVVHTIYRLREMTS